MPSTFVRCAARIPRSLIQPTVSTIPGPSLARNRNMSGSAGVSDLQVIHDQTANEFYIPMSKEGDNSDNKAVLQYYYISPKYVDLEHTVVPEQFRGKGVAKLLAKAAFDHFVEKKIDIRPTCTYLQKFYRENKLPEYQDRVKWD